MRPVSFFGSSFLAFALLATGCGDATDPAPRPTDSGTTGNTTSVVEGAPRIDQVSIVAISDSIQVRQGHGDVEVEVSGEHLADVTTVTLGSLELRILDSTDARLLVGSTIDADAALGELDLEVTNAAGSASWLSALEVTHLTASSRGSDGAGRGTPDSPLRSITAAVALAAERQVVSVEAGTYDEAHGETWPVVLEDVELLGAGPELTILEGPGTDLGLRLQGGTLVSDLQVTGFRDGIATNEGAHELHRVHVVGNTADGFVASYVQSTLYSVAVYDSEFRDNGHEGFIANSAIDTATFRLSNVNIEGNGVRGLYVLHDVTATLEDVTLHDNGVGLVLTQDAVVNATNLVVSNSDHIGIEGLDDAILDLTGASVTGNLGNGIEFGGTSLTMRDSDVLNNVGDGVRVRRSATADLGSAGDPGNNRIGVDKGGISLGDYLADDRTADQGEAILAFGVDLGTKEAVGIHIGTWASNSPYWAFQNDGNAINFGF